MAPIKKRVGMRAKLASASRPKPTPTNSIHPNARPSSSSKSSAAAAPSFPSNTIDLDSAFGKETKKDKQRIKHSSFISRIEKSHAKTPKRRRPSKKLNMQLESLVDALPDLESGSGSDGEEWEGVSDDDAMSDDVAKSTNEADMLSELGKMVRVRKSLKKKPKENTMAMKTLKSRPGAAKRKELLEKGEMERFGRNLAQMSSVPAAATTTVGADVTGDRWKALRGFIGQTMEKNPMFKGAS